MSNLPLNSIRRFVNNGRILRIAGTLLAALIICSCEEYPEPYGAGAGFYPRAAPAGWWHDEGASGKSRIVVHTSEQKAYFYKGKTLVGETTVSTGKPGFGTPPGHYTVLTKDVDHVSTEFGDYVDGSGNVVRSNIDSRKDRQPKGTHFDGARMPYAMFFRGGYAMHQGYVPPFAASHGCIRIPKGMASQFFEHASVGTPVTVTE
ncbi:MAG: L,D-transpeptidase family protein [Candidatus Udaeobacter sp.]